MYIYGWLKHQCNGATSYREEKGVSAPRTAIQSPSLSPPPLYTPHRTPGYQCIQYDKCNNFSLEHIKSLGYAGVFRCRLAGARALSRWRVR